jgi:arylsulfatase A-like enzyme
MRRDKVKTVCVAAVLIAAGVSLPEKRPDGVLVITLDTTRADRLSPYGFMDATMPALERLAHEGVVFDRATSVAPLTLPAHTSLFTGLIPPKHGVRDNGDPALSHAHTTLAEVLSNRGFHCGAFVGSVVLDADRGLARGFEIYRGAVPFKTAKLPERRADEVVADAVRWLDQVGDSPYFLWVHLYDAHRPYDPPEPYRSSIADPYVGELLFVDSQIGRLLGVLEGRKMLDRTIVVVAADHGESLGEHGERDHGIFVYDSVIRIPLIVRAPGLFPRRVAEPVRLTDVVPTVLSMLGLPSPPTDGVNLSELMAGRKPHLHLDAYSESLYPERFGWSGLRALSDGRFKVIDAPHPELYDLERDPFEHDNIYDERGGAAAALHVRLRAMTGDRAPARAVSGDLRERLTSLGYVGAGPVSGVKSGGAAPDPKDCIAARDSPDAHTPAECRQQRRHRDPIETARFAQD